MVKKKYYTQNFSKLSIKHFILAFIFIWLGSSGDLLGGFSTEKISGSINNNFPCFNITYFDVEDILSYGGGQDLGNAIIQDNQQTILVKDNGWKAIPYEYNITSNTVISFEFKSSQEGEEHSIGFDTDLSLNGNIRFKLFGTQSASGAIENFSNYNSIDNYESYIIPIGQFHTGEINYMFFNMDNDANASIGTSYFKNIIVFEDVNGNGINDDCNCYGGVPNGQPIPNCDAPIFINEVMANNKSVIADEEGEYDDWIEIYNAGANPINLADFYLTDDLSEPTKWQIPNTNAALTTIAPKDFLLLWADDDIEQGENHLSFKLSSSGESIFLFDQDGITLLDELTFTDLQEDESYGKKLDGGAELIRFNQSSPIDHNKNGSSIAPSPTINPIAGVYTNAQQITINVPPQTTVYYTTDGSTPTASSNLYSAPFMVNSTSSIRAVSIREGLQNSLIETESYIINTAHDLSILSVNIDPKYLWSDEEGMYVTGTNGINADCSGGTPANFWQEWEYPSNVIMFDESGEKVFDVDGGLSLFGNCSRRYAQKSIQLKTKSQYPSDNIPYQVFPQRDQNEFRRLRFRSGGNHWRTSMMGDAVAQRLVENLLDVEIQSARPAVVYLNSQYWGIHNIRDAYSKHYFEYKFPEYKGDDFEIMRLKKIFTEIVPIEGDPSNFGNLYQYFNDNSPFTQENFDYAKERIDLNNLLNYYMLQMWLMPGDWPGTHSPSNQIFWRSASSNSKWRLAVLDTDGGWSNIQHNTINYIMVPALSGRNTAPTTLLIRKLMENPTFKAEFIQRYATQLNLIFSPARVNTFIDDYKDLLDTEIPAHTSLWGSQGGVANYNTWVTEVNKLKTYANGRSDILRDHIANFYGLGTFELTLNFDANSHGKVVVNSNYFGVPYNYSGVYFNQEPIEIHAVAAPGYRFVEWQETGSTNPNLYESFSDNTTLTPVFEPVDELITNEIHYHPNDTIHKKEFLEIYNPSDVVRNIGKFKFGKGIEFEFPEAATIGAKEFIVIAEDSDQFAGNGYQVFEWTRGGLDKNGESLVLQNSLGQTIDSIAYNDKNPWDEMPDGKGYSLELLHPSLDRFDPLSWFQSDAIDGSPGEENSRICDIPNTTIIINEINYNSDNDNFDSGDWVELYNPNESEVNLSNWSFYNNEGKFIFPQGTTFPAKSYLILVEDSTSFNNVFTNIPANIIVGQIPFSLSNKGERLSLFDQNKCLVDDVNYNDKTPWSEEPDGGGSTLSLIDVSLDNALAPHWRSSIDLSSDYVHGSPGQSNTCTGISNKVIYSQISSSNNDAEENISDGIVTLTSKDLDLGNDEGTIFIVGMRFQNIGIPQGAEITSAVIEFATDEINREETNIIFKGENIDNAPVFENLPQNISNRITTSNSVTWTPSPWNTIGKKGFNQKTADLSSIIQEIIDRPGFSSGNAIVIIAEGTGIRTAESFDGSSSLAPKLCISYTFGECGVFGKILLEGFYDEENGNMHTNLLENNLLPLSQPFNTTPWNYNGSETATTIPTDAVDWILINTRDTDGNIINQAAGFINTTGELMNVNGELGIPIANAEGKLISIHHRSHLDILSALNFNGDLYDFASAEDQVAGIGQLKLIDGKYMLHAGDYDGSGIINSEDFNGWKIQSAIINQYLPIDGDGNGIVNSLDYNLWQKNKSKVGHPTIRY